MKTPALERTSAAKAGWLIIVLTIGWLVFLLLPDPPKKPAAPAASVPVPATSLTRSGLHEYTDWEGLPEIFAIWADKAEWKNNRTRFAYWHPVMKSYSYYFEAARTAQGYHFREITEPHDTDHFWDESLGDDCPLRFYRAYPNLKLKNPELPSTATQTMESMKPKPDAPAVVIPINPTPKP